MSVANISGSPSFLYKTTDNIELQDIIDGRIAEIGGGDSLNEAPDGTEALPAIAFLADPDSGIYRTGPDNIGISAGGVNQLDISSSTICATNQIQGADGTLTVPGYSFCSDPDSGLYLPAAGNVAVTVGGDSICSFRSDRIFIEPSSKLVNQSGTTALPSYTFSADQDTGFYLQSVGNLAFSVGNSQKINISSSSVDFYDPVRIKYNAGVEQLSLAQNSGAYNLQLFMNSNDDFQMCNANIDKKLIFETNTSGVAADSFVFRPQLVSGLNHRTVFNIGNGVGYDTIFIIDNGGSVISTPLKIDNLTTTPAAGFVLKSLDASGNLDWDSLTTSTNVSAAASSSGFTSLTGIDVLAEDLGNGTIIVSGEFTASLAAATTGQINFDLGQTLTKVIGAASTTKSVHLDLQRFIVLNASQLRFTAINSTGGAQNGILYNFSGICKY